MLQNNRWAIVEWSSIVGKAVHNAIQRCENRGTCLHEQVERDMNRAPLRPIVALRFENLAGIYRPGFVVSTDAYLAVGRFHTFEEAARECLCIRYLCQAA